MRDIFIKKITNLAHKNKKIFLIVGDLGFNVVEEFSSTFKNRFLNTGIAEQNMMGLAAGIASEGMHVYVYSIANFPTFRCAEQIRNDVDYHNLNVTIVCVGGGVSYGNLGYSHHAIQDYSLMRSMPNMLIASPGDFHEINATVDYLNKNPQPSYLRLDKSYNKSHHSNKISTIPGKWQKIIPSKNKKIFLVTGNTIGVALTLLNKKKYFGYGLYSLPLWSLKTKNIQLKQIINFREIITVEDHLLDAGFGSWLTESVMNTNTKIKIYNMGFSDKIFNRVGDQKTLHKIAGLE